MAIKKNVEQQKILRVFRLINLLRGNIGKNVHRLAETLETDPRTIYRYFKLLEELGFQIEKEFGKFRIVDRLESPTHNLLGTFTEEETEFLAQAISQAGKKSLLKDAILEKVNARSEIQQSVQTLFNAKLGLFVDDLADAIKNKFQVLLVDYYSMNSDSVKDRLIEPVAFSKDYEFIHGFEVESKKMKKFKLERVSDVKVEKKKHKYSSLHEAMDDSMFGYSGTAKYPVKLKLSKKAYQLMIEEHPETKPFTYTRNRKHYYFENEVAEFPGIARFIMGLPGEIILEEGEELRGYLNEQKAKLKF
jgi:predicted DNA-binding transcriptional regulator YafY